MRDKIIDLLEFHKKLPTYVIAHYLVKEGEKRNTRKVRAILLKMEKEGDVRRSKWETTPQGIVWELTP